MASERSDRIRLRFFGTGDYGTYFQVEEAFKLLDDFDTLRTDYNVNDIVELQQVLQYVEHGLFPPSASEAERDAKRSLRPELNRVIADFFNTLTDGNFASTITDIDHQYHTDVLALMAKFNVFKRCSASIVLPALQSSGVHCGELLSCQQLVRTYDQDIRDLILANVRNAEQIVAKYLHPEEHRPIFLPTNFTASDSRTLLDAYLDDAGANPNFVNLIAKARVSKSTGIDAKLKLKARRVHEKWTKEFFENNTGVTTGCEITIVDDQSEEVVATLEGMVGKYSYSRRWLTENLDYPTILNNFVYLFEWANRHMLLLLPSYAAQLGVFERYIFTVGKDNYKVGAAFQHLDQASFLQTVMYEQFLRSEGIELEAVVEWFFTTYLKTEFGAANLKFQPSSPTATYLEKSRHLFSEMESVLKQFGLYIDNGELDRDLLSISSEQLSYKQVPSHLEGKYVYIANQSDILRIQRLLFSDQSSLTYINDALRDTSLARLIVANEVAYDDFLDHQKQEIDFLLAQGILENTGARIKFSNAQQFYVLMELSDHEATSYYHYPPAGRKTIDDMEAKDWLEKRSSLLTPAEASYFNYFLNQAEFTDGPDLRNRYLHGSQADGDDDRVHFRTYMIALRLLIALTIKINDDFNLQADQGEQQTPG